jgi:serine/threonine-protein kinase
MAAVYRAEQERLKKTVALKVMDPLVAEDEEYRERFLREARAAAKLNHQNLVRALDAGCAGGFYYIAMELVEGVDLRKRIEDEGPLPEREALQIAIAVCHALDEASRHGIVHRDVKPENILLAREGVVKLTDLGLAKVRGEDVTLTKKGLTVGTVAYFAPEQALGQPDLDVRTDLYALGATLYAAVSGELPFGRGDNVPETMQRILTEPPPSLREIAPDVSDPTRLVIERFMEKDRKRRPQTAREAIRQLESAVAGEVPGVILAEQRVESARQSARKSLRRNAQGPRATTGVGLAVGVVAAAAALIAAPVILRHEAPATSEPVGATAPVGVASARGPSVASAVPTPSPAVVAHPAPSAVPVSPGGPDAKPPEDAELHPPAPDEAVEAARSDPPAPPPASAPPALPADAAPPAAPAVDVPLDAETLGKLVHAKVEVEKTGLAVLRYDALDAAALADFEAEGPAPEPASGALVWKLGPGKRATWKHRVVLGPPVSIAFDLLVSEQAAKARFETVFAGASGAGLGSCGGARLDAWEGGAATKRLAGSEAAESLFAQGARHRVEVALEATAASGKLDGTERYRVEASPPLAASVRFEITGGVKVELRHLRIRGRIDKAWLRAATGGAAEGTPK